MISIIVPVYNASKYLDDCLRSIQNQSYINFEVLCIDDGSEDDSADVIIRYVASDSRFKLYQQKNAGVSAARNLGLKNADGEYISFVDSDDMIGPNYLENLLALSNDDSLAICGYTRDILQLNHNNGKIKKYQTQDYIRHIFNEDIEHPNICMMLFKKSIIQMHHLNFTVGCVRNEDTEFYIKYMIHERNVSISNYKGYYYRPNPTSVMSLPITLNSLTSIEASQRMNKLLYDKKIIDSDKIIYSNGILVYVYATAKQKQQCIYDYLHEKYNVRCAMVAMLKHTRLIKRLVALTYILLGRKLFYMVVSLIH